MSYSLTYRFSVLVFTRSPPAASLDNFPAAVQLRLNLHLFTLTLLLRSLLDLYTVKLHS